MYFRLSWRLIDCLFLILDEDQEVWIDNEVFVNFEVVDKEFGIGYCEWVIGMFCFYSFINDYICYIILQLCFNNLIIIIFFLLFYNFIK